MSVLTDRRFFKGSYHDLAAVKAAVRVPVLCKDFILDERQIDAAFCAGADAVLLMLSILNDGAYMRLSDHARALGMEILTEVHNIDEMARALVLGAKLIGINNRDLRTLDVSLETTRTLAPLAPDRVTLVGESGIAERRDVRGLAPLVDGFLVGSATMRSPRPDLVIRDLVFGAVKVCGLTRRGDARAAYNAGATYGGINFVGGTPRAVSRSKARAIIGNVPLKWVGVFRNSEAQFVANAARDLALSAVQLHGNEDGDYRRVLRGLLPTSCEIWQAVEATGPASLVRPQACDRLLLDRRDGTRFGGSGKPFDWCLLDGVRDRESLGLAGGLTPENASRAAALGVGLIDVCSGVESEAGIKSQPALKAFFNAIQSSSGRERGIDRC